MSVAGNTRIGDLDGANTFFLIWGLDLRTAREWLDRPVSTISKKMNRRARQRAHEATAHTGSDDQVEHLRFWSARERGVDAAVVVVDGPVDADEMVSTSLRGWQKFRPNFGFPDVFSPPHARKGWAEPFRSTKEVKWQKWPNRHSGTRSCGHPTCSAITGSR